MADSLYGALLQGTTVVVSIVSKSRAGFDEYNYHDFLQVRAMEGIGHWPWCDLQVLGPQWPECERSISKKKNIALLRRSSQTTR